MNTYFVRYTLIISTICLLFSGYNVSAKTFTINDVSYSNLASAGAWSSVGSTNIFKDGSVSIREMGSQKNYVFKDVEISSRDGNRVLLIAYTKVHRVGSQNVLTSDTTGLPYLYGYAMNRQGRILSYLQGRDMTHDFKNENKWDVSSGVFDVPYGTVKIRIFLKQAERRGTAKGNFEAWFYEPGVYVVARESDASFILNGYLNSISLIPNDIGKNVLIAATPTPQVSIASGNDACSPSGSVVLQTTFEHNTSIDSRFRFASLIPSWTYTPHDYYFNNVAASITHEAAYDGTSALRLLNPSYGFENGRERTSPSVTDEAVGYDVTNLFSSGEKYRVSMRVRVSAPAGAGVVPVMIAKETRSFYSAGEISQSYSTSIGSEWKCLYLDVRQEPRGYYGNAEQSVAEDVVLFFGGLPIDAKMYVDNVRITRL
jgi:hypothetical protein